MNLERFGNYHDAHSLNHHGGYPTRPVGSSSNWAAGSLWCHPSTPSPQLVTINTTTGAGTAVGAALPAGQYTGIGFRGNSLYLAEQTGNAIQQVDPATAAPIGAPIILGIAFNGEGDLTFRADGVGFLIDTGGPPNGRYWTIDPIAPALLSGPTPTVPPTPFRGLAFNGPGVLYGLLVGPTPTAELYTLDPATGATTLVGDTLQSGYNYGGLAFDQAGNLYAALSQLGLPGTSTLFKLDPTTGSATLIGNIGFANVTGLSFQPPAPPPAPPPPPLPPPTPIPPPIPTVPVGLGEGSFAEKPGTSGGEGTFGFGRQLRTLQPFLKGPHRDPNGIHRVFNAAHQQPQPTAQADSGLGVVGWGLIGLAILAPAVLVFGRRRPV